MKQPPPMKTLGLRIPLPLAREIEAELAVRSKVIGGPRTVSELVRTYILRCLASDRPKPQQPWRK